ncbi:hypothetical protein ABPG74_015410 [Tetrahymena malaccensis]
MLNRNRKQDTDKSFYSKVQEQVKLRAFEVVYQLLRLEENSFLFNAVLTIIEFLQIIFFSFTDVNSSYWNSSKIQKGIETFLSFFLIYPNLVKYCTSSTYIAVFYICVIIIVVILLFLLYVSMYSQYKLPFSWPITISKYLVVFTMHIFYLAFIDLFSNIFGCTSVTVNGVSKTVLSDYNDVECWTGIHILHCFVAVVFIGTLTFLVLFLSQTFFDSKMSSQDPVARANGHITYTFNIYKLVVVVMFVFMSTSQFIYLILGMILGGSIIIFQRAHFNSPFYNRSFFLLYDVMTVWYLWTSACLASAILLENNFYTGTIVIWIIGSPILIIFVLLSRDEKVDGLFSNVNKFANGEEIIQQSRVLINLLQMYKLDQQIHITLDGYIEIHKQLCNKQDCSLVAKNNQKINRILKQIKTNNPEIDNEKHAKIIQVVYQMFYEGTKRFPNHTNLRINYASFLIEKMKFKQTALQELTIAEENFPPFDIQFTIFRLKKIIEEEIQNENKQNKMKIGGNIDEELGVLDIISEIRYQEIFKQLRADIELSSEAHMDFWQQLSEETPDMKKVHQFGRHIYRAKAKVENDWLRLTRICDKRPKAYRFYASYIIEIIQDQKTGQQLHTQANFLQNNGKKYQNRTKGEQDIEQDTDSQPCIIISAESDKLGQIQHLNLAATILIGSSKTELINNNINKLMPNLYGQNHDQFLENYLNRNEFNYFKEERHLFITHKSSYIIPIYLRVKSFDTLMHGLQLIGNIRYDKQFRNQAYILINVEGQINSISSTCISMLKLDYKLVNSKEKKIDQFFPQLMEERDNYMNKQGQVYQYYFPSANAGSNKDIDSLKTKPKIKSINLKIQISEICFTNDEFVGYIIKIDKVTDLAQNSRLRPNPTLSTFQFSYEKQTKGFIGEYGFVPGSEADSQSHEQNLNNSISSLNDNQSYNQKQSKLQKQKNNSNQSSLTNIPKKPTDQILKQPNKFSSPQRQAPASGLTQPSLGSAEQKKYNNSPDKHINEIQENDREHDNEDIEDDNELPKNTLQTEGNKQENDYNKNRYIKNTLYQDNMLKNDVQMTTNYEQGIKTVRLFKNKIHEMHDFKDDDSENSEKEEEDLEDSIFRQSLDDGGEESTKLNHNFNDTFTSKKALNSVINSKIVPQEIRVLNAFVKIFLLLLTVISFVEYFVGVSVFSNIKSDIQLITYSCQRIANFQYILANIRDLQLNNDKLYTFSTTDINNLVADTKTAISDTDKISNYLLLNTNRPSSTLSNMLTNSQVKVILDGGSSQYYSFNQVTSQMISKALSIINSGISNINKSNSDVQNFYMNIMNDYQSYLRTTNTLYLQDLKSETNNQSTLFFVLLLISPIIICLFMSLLYPVLNFVNKSSGKVINLFLHVPNKYIQQLHTQCQNFVSQLRADEDDTQSVNDLDRDDDNQGFGGQNGEQGEEEIMKRKKKKYVNQIDNNIITIISKMLFGVLVLEAYFIATYFLGNNLLNNIETLLPEYNYTAYSESLYIFSDNAQRNYFINPTYNIFNEDQKTVCLNDVNDMFELDSNILYEHSQNIQIISSSYKNDFIQIITKDPCQIFLNNNIVSSIDQCSQFANGAVSSGMTAAFTRYFENIRQLLTYQQQILEGVFSWDNVKPGFTEIPLGINNSTLNSIINLLRLPVAQEIRDMQRNYIKFSVRYLVQSFQSSLQNNLDTIQTIKFILFLIFIAMIFLMYLVFWWPIADSLTEDIWRTQSLLSAVPVHVLKLVRPMQIYIKYLYDEQQRELTKKKQKADDIKNKDSGKSKLII